MWPYISTLLPTAGLLYLFYVVMKHVVEGDRRERAAHAEWERQEDEKELRRQEEEELRRRSHS